MKKEANSKVVIVHKPPVSPGTSAPKSEVPAEQTQTEEPETKPEEEKDKTC
ncbi:MAG: hypothetical protein IJL42_00635 [Bacteroidales bacterium]|jgi:hypothetical protein|nr:hypothetical protein [Bacteroidales bacterium]